jgi:Uma2 family endonuclease
MSTLASQPRTYTPEDLLAMPDGVGYELVDGKLVERHVSVESSRIATEMARVLSNEARRTGEAVVYGSDLGYRCFPDDPGRVRKPDVSVVRKSRLAEFKADRGYMTVPADLAIEVVSPNDLYSEVQTKVAEYLEAGFAVVWVVDPLHKAVAVYNGSGGVKMLHDAETIDAAPALGSFHARVGEFFTE